MRKYELALVFAPDEKETEREKLLNKVKDEIEKLKGKIEKVNDWGKKQLNFPIKKHSEGVFFVLEFSVPANEINGLDRKIRLEEKIIRHLLVRLEQ